MPQPLQGKISIVTGASRGIGRSIAMRLAACGFERHTHARDQQLLDSAASEIRAAGGNGGSHRVGSSWHPTPASASLSFALNKFGRVDTLVNNAGATKRGEFLQLADDDFADGFALKLLRAVRLTRACWTHLKAAFRIGRVHLRRGRRTPGAQFTIGGSVNAALLSLTKALADLGLRDGVQVNAINPGTIRTAVIRPAERISERTRARSRCR